MRHELLLRTTLLFLVTICFSLALQHSTETQQNNQEKVYQSENEELLRVKRAVRKPGFFKTLFSVIYEQWNDTRNTVGGVNKLINDNFLPENQPIVEQTTPSDPNVSTTTPAYKITRSEFNKIIRRNLKGLQRLFNIELQDALKQSTKTDVEFRKNTSREVSKFL